MKKSTTRTTLIIVFFVIAIVGYYAFLTNRDKTAREETAMTVVQNTLSRDLNKDYPPTPKEVLKYYNEIFRCLYNEPCTEEDVEALGLKARELYDDDLLAINELGTYLLRLQTEVQSGRDKEQRITTISLAPSVNVDIFQQDGYDFARLQCSYNIIQSGQNYSTTQIYLLRKDSNKRWKIYGWQDEEKMKPSTEYTLQ